MSAVTSDAFRAKRARYLFHAIRVMLGLVFIWSSIHKLRQPYEFLATVYGYSLVGSRLGVAIAALLPWAELVTGVCLIGNLLTRGALLSAVLLGSLFTFANASALYRGLGISCGCFGATGDKVGAVTLLRSALVVLAAAAACWLDHRLFSGPVGVMNSNARDAHGSASFGAEPNVREALRT